MLNIVGPKEQNVIPKQTLASEGQEHKLPIASIKLSSSSESQVSWDTW